MRDNKRGTIEDRAATEALRLALRARRDRQPRPPAAPRLDQATRSG